MRRDPNIDPEDRETWELDDPFRSHLDPPTTPYLCTRCKQQPALPGLGICRSCLQAFTADSTRLGPPVRAEPTAELRAAQATAAAEQRAAAAVKVREIEQHIHLCINAQRQAHGRSPLRHIDHLAAVARAHSDDMVNRNYFDHDTPEGLKPWDRIARSGYNCNSGAGENLAIELDEINPQHVAEQAVQSWMNSAGHRTNLLDGRYSRTGIGASFGTYRGYRAWYLTQLFCF